MTYKELRHIVDGFKKADPEALAKIDVIDAVEKMGVDIDEQTDSEFEQICAIVSLRYDEYLRTKWPNKPIDYFCYGIGEWLENNQDKSSYNTLCDIDNVDWDWVFDYVSEMD